MDTIFISNDSGTKEKKYTSHKLIIFLLEETSYNTIVAKLLNHGCQIQSDLSGCKIQTGFSESPFLKDEGFIGCVCCLHVKIYNDVRIVNVLKNIFSEVGIFGAVLIEGNGHHVFPPSISRNLDVQNGPYRTAGI